MTEAREESGMSRAATGPNWARPAFPFRSSGLHALLEQSRLWLFGHDSPFPVEVALMWSQAADRMVCSSHVVTYSRILRYTAVL